MDIDGLLETCRALAREAGAAIMEVYASDDFDLEYKADASPLTKADRLANDIIERGLARATPAYPIISEEGGHSAGGQDTFWLVDPLDGTKEFIKHSDEFTVNIGLIRAAVPVLGVVYVPAKRLMYFGADGHGAFRQSGEATPVAITAEFTAAVPAAVVSRNHLNAATQAFVDQVGEHTAVSIGSSLKFCLVAEGQAAVYPRLAPTSLWDTAAADAIVRAAGGSVVDTGGEPLRYRDDQLLNPSFVACARGWREKLRGAGALPNLKT